MYLLLIIISGFFLHLYFYTNSVSLQETDIYLTNDLAGENSSAHSGPSGGSAESNFTILHLSDFHFTGEGILEDKIRKKVAELDYDLVALTGDYLEDRGYLADFFRYLDSLNFTAPVVAVPGNHDYNNYFNDLKLRFESRGIKFLHNESFTHHHDSCNINLIGVGSPNWGRDDLEMALQRRRPDWKNFAKNEARPVNYADNRVSEAESSQDTEKDNKNIKARNDNRKDQREHQKNNIREHQKNDHRKNQGNDLKENQNMYQRNDQQKDQRNGLKDYQKKDQRNGLKDYQKKDQRKIQRNGLKEDQSIHQRNDQKNDKIEDKNDRMNQGDKKNAIDNQDKKEINIILSHTHEIVDSLEEESASCGSSGVDLILAGDTHGGQINIPFLSSFVLPLVFNRDKGYIAGRYNHGSTAIYINRGLGTTILPLRFNSRPEITLVKLKH